MHPTLLPSNHAAALDEERSRLADELSRCQQALHDIHHSTGWKLLQRCIRIKNRLCPPCSWRDRSARWLVRNLRRCRHWPQRREPAPPVAPAEVGPATYGDWIVENEPDQKELERQRSLSPSRRPRIGVAVSVVDPTGQFLQQLVDSVLDQTSSNWELCIVDFTGSDALAEFLGRCASADSRITVRSHPRLLANPPDRNLCWQLASSDLIAFVDEDCVLAPFAIHEIAESFLACPEADVLYADGDTIDRQGHVRSHPHFKPDWSPDLQRGTNYVGAPVVIRKAVLEQIGGIRSEFGEDSGYDLVLRATEAARRIVHLPKILFHERRRQRMNLRTADAGLRIVQDHLDRQRLPGTVRPDEAPGAFRVCFDIMGNPRVSIVIPNKDSAAILLRCVESIRSSSYANHEIVIVENNSTRLETFQLYDRLKSDRRIAIVSWNESFNYSRVCNFGATQATGDMLVMMNNDTEVINPDWLERMLEYAQRQHVGAVGAKLYFPDGRIQHGGVFLGPKESPGHVHYGYPRNADGYFRRLRLVQNASAVTAACMMLRRDVFDSVGGFCETLAVEYNDVDLCLKIRAAGYLLVWTPFAELYHHESLTRGPINARRRREMDILTQRWSDSFRDRDPYFSPHLFLPCFREQIRLSPWSGLAEKAA